MSTRQLEMRLVASEECGDPPTGLFRFERPADYAARAGQWLRMTLPTREGDVTRTFSDAAAPVEPVIEIATRLTGSPFKDAMRGLRPGDRVRFSGPGGRLAIAAGTDRVAFLMGGVGITPGRSIIRERVLASDDSAELVLFYGNNEEACVPFGDELRGLDRECEWFHLIEVIARPSPAWGGERGFITPETVLRHLDPADGWHFMVAGPPAMVDPMRRVLDDLNVPSDRRSFESFAGYR